MLHIVTRKKRGLKTDAAFCEQIQDMPVIVFACCVGGFVWVVFPLFTFFKRRSCWLRWMLKMFYAANISKENGCKNMKVQWSFFSGYVSLLTPLSFSSFRNLDYVVSRNKPVIPVVSCTWLYLCLFFVFFLVSFLVHLPCQKHQKRAGQKKKQYTRTKNETVLLFPYFLFRISDSYAVWNTSAWLSLRTVPHWRKSGENLRNASLSDWGWISLFGIICSLQLFFWEGNSVQLFPCRSRLNK